MITTLKVNLGKDLGPMHLIKHVIQTWDGELVLDGDIIDGLKIHTYILCTILLRYQKSGN